MGTLANLDDSPTVLDLVEPYWPIILQLAGTAWSLVTVEISASPASSASQGQYQTNPREWLGKHGEQVWCHGARVLPSRANCLNFWPWRSEE